MFPFLTPLLTFAAGIIGCHLYYRYQLNKAVASFSDPSSLSTLPVVKTLKEKAQQEITRIQNETDEILERYDILTENLAASVTIRDADNNIAYCSPYTEVLTGYSLDDIYEADGDFFYALVHEEDQERYARALRVVTAGEPFQYRYRFFHKSGLEMWAETRTVPLLDKNDNLLSSLSITLDVTGTIRYQQQVEEKNQDLKDFTYMVTHDLKSPIYTVKGMVNVIEEDCSQSLPAEAKEPLEHIKTAVRRLETLVGSVLEYSEISSTELVLEEVKLDDVLKDLQNDFKHQLEECQAQFERENNLPSVYANSLKLYQILSNLIGNAIKYRSPERPLIIKIREHEHSEERYVTLEFSDNGPGIAREKLHNIFRPFQRAITEPANKSPEGSGIGLACVQKLTHKLGGDIEVQSEPGVGTTFLLRFKRVS